MSFCVCETSVYVSVCVCVHLKSIRERIGYRFAGYGQVDYNFGSTIEATGIFGNLFAFLEF